MASNLAFVSAILASATCCFAFSPEVQQMQRDVIELKEQVLALRQENAELRDKMLSEAKVSTQVAFWAVKTSQQELSDGELVIFDNIELNLGDAFQTSTLVCPVSGIYYIQFHLNNGDNAANGTIGSATLVLDEEPQVQARSRVTGPTLVQMTISQGMLIFCAEGSKIYVRSDADNNSLGNEGRSSSFLGYLVYQG